MMDFLLENEFDINIQKLSHIFESEYSSYLIFMKELEFNKDMSVVTESDYSLIKDEEDRTFGQKLGKVLAEIGNAIIDFINDITFSISNAFASKELKNAMKEAMNAEDSVKTKKVKVDMSKKELELLNEYIREVVKLERELMSIKLDIRVSKGEKQGKIIDANRVLMKLEKLEARYSKEFLDKHSDIITMAADDAIRFSDKQLNNVKLDIDAIKTNSKHVLQEFKKDAKGCDVPVKLNILQKMMQGIGTKVRQVVNIFTKRRKKNILAILAVAGVTFAGGAFISKFKQDKDFKNAIADKVGSTKTGKKFNLDTTIKMVNATPEEMAEIQAEIANRKREADERLERLRRELAEREGRSG